ncbi:ADP-ribosylglycohydrolase family protein [Bittarella massiliensis (ex Durand et al. 2017)]|uniref:ADP-ribosylglycohydrolase family protein n=1 Tax=Bittarella massiliensis (ex Durand et al. 2017) TaxID=1720313 RepID=A0AAW5KH47_9FIRM|nr:ADP-ribosylglycohydrolase family protein [Bittarella massiliensis (ex Durand et al. 2017)]MCQ4949550.1 ADP-ribosylglycohydrolase family protein [Bittarella massiliensis (ex Durand et al. 2017)]
MTLNERILGGLVLAAAGDAIGAATETRSTALIEERFGGPVRDFIDAPEDTFARGAKAGTVTDDFSLAWCTAMAIAERGGVIDEACAKDALVRWHGLGDYFERYAGPTTRAAVMAMLGTPMEAPLSFLACDNSKASNGGAMKIEAVGYVNPGDWDRAVEDAITICLPTHPYDIALSGACAVAAACAEAVREGADLFSIVKAGAYGAQKGYEKGGRVGARLAGPSVERRIWIAAELGMRAPDIGTAMRDISDIIGTGLAAAEAVPAAFGLLVAGRGDPVEATLAGVNIGSDTDTVATIVGSIAGAHSGIGALPEHYLEVIDRVNGYDLRGLADRLAEVAAER